jgi:fructokinase
MTQYIGIEGGGTKFVCAHGSGPDDLKDRTVIQTRGPQETMADVVEYIKNVQQNVDIKAIGASVFGPLDLDLNSKTYGYITPTAKVEWSNFDFVGTLKKHFNLPIGFDTDVNAAAIGEYYWGAAKGLSDFIYLTVGTGIGGGAMVNSEFLHGAMHPEMGHIYIPQHPDDTFAGVCSHHKNCFEGLASGPAMKERWKVDSALHLPEDHQAWDLEAHYLGIGLANYSLVLSPKKIILGGGVMRQEHLLPKIRQQMLQSLAGYLQNHYLDDIDNYIVKPGLGENAAICGALALAKKISD